MIEILAYAFGIMYTPGPSNLLSLNAGLNGHINSTLRFCLGVACAMLILFLLFGFTGAWLVSQSYQLIISFAGSIYIAYLAFKITKATLDTTTTEQTDQKESSDGNLNFRSGLVMQLLNPKSLVAILPIVTVQFPAAHITGSSILVWSIALSILAFGAPSFYLLMGSRLGKLIQNPRYFRVLNLSMALLLLYVAVDIAYSHVYLKWA